MRNPPKQTSCRRCRDGEERSGGGGVYASIVWAKREVIAYVSGQFRVGDEVACERDQIGIAVRIGPLSGVRLERSGRNGRTVRNVSGMAAERSVGKRRR
jgi:hypothetical protein